MRTTVQLIPGNNTLYALADDGSLWVMARNIQTFVWEWRRMVDLPQNGDEPPPEATVSVVDSIAIADSPPGTP